MLVLTRKEGERIHIGDIVLTVVRLAGTRVRLGVEAPATVPIVRAEIGARCARRATPPHRRDDVA